MSNISRFFQQKIIFNQLTQDEQMKVLTYSVGDHITFRWYELDNHGNTNFPTARTMVLNEKGRSGRSAMTKHTQNVLDTLPEDERGRDIISMSLESLLIMLKEIIVDGDNNNKAKKFMNALESPYGVSLLFLTQVLSSGEVLIQNGYEIENGAFLEARIKARNAAKGKLSNLYRRLYNNQIDLVQFQLEMREIMDTYTNKFMVTFSQMEKATEEKLLYSLTDKDSIQEYVNLKIDEIREQITGVKRLFALE